MKRVLIADDHEITRIGVQTLLETEGKYKICGQASDGREAVEMACCLTPDLIVLDLGLPLLHGWDAARQILSANPKQCILIFTEINSDRTIREALELRIRGYMLKSDELCDMLKAAEAVLRGGTFFTSHNEILLAFTRTEERQPPLSDRECQVVQLVAAGHGTTEIAKILGTSAKTVDAQRTNIRRKLQISSTAELVLYAVRNEIVRIPELSAGTPSFVKSPHAFSLPPGREPTSQDTTSSDAWLETPISASENLGFPAQAGAGD